VLRGVAVPFHQSTLVADVVDGRLMVAVESFDERSFATLPDKVPLLVSHDSGQPIGWAALHLEPDALRAEARLEGGAAHLDQVIELVKAGLMAAMSIGFTVGTDDQWSKGPTPDAPPRVLRRGAKLRDVSLVTRPAYAAAQVETLRHRTALQAWSDEEMREYRERKAQEEAEAARARAEYEADLDRFLVDARARQAELEVVFAARAAADTPTPPPSTPAAGYEIAFGNLVRVDKYGSVLRVIGPVDTDDPPPPDPAAAVRYEVFPGYVNVRDKAGNLVQVLRRPT
jgi:HK97 family phage prohead protease